MIENGLIQFADVAKLGEISMLEWQQGKSGGFLYGCYRYIVLLMQNDI